MVGKKFAETPIPNFVRVVWQENVARIFWVANW